MDSEIKVAIIGLDTSHSVEFPRRMQSPDYDPKFKVSGLRAVSCLRFETPFIDKNSLDARQKQLEAWGVKVTESFDEAVSDCDAIMLEINDPAYHLEYFKKAAALGKRIFIDKPLADNIANGAEIAKIAKENNLEVISASPLRFVPELSDACRQINEVRFGAVYGPLGKAPAGSSIVWYGVHAFEMLEKILGKGALSVIVTRDGVGAAAVVDYPDRRRGIVELSKTSYLYGGTIRSNDKAASYLVSCNFYTETLKEVKLFFNTGKASLDIGDAVEVMALLDAAERSFQNGRTEPVYQV
jgi:predicted dehydrogenase